MAPLTNKASQSAIMTILLDVVTIVVSKGHLA